MEVEEWTESEKKKNEWILLIRRRQAGLWTMMNDAVSTEFNSSRCGVMYETDYVRLQVGF